MLIMLTKFPDFFIGQFQQNLSSEKDRNWHNIQQYWLPRWIDGRMTHLWSCGTASLSPWFLLGFLFGGFLFVFISNRVCRKEKKKENLLFCLTSKQKRLHCPVTSWRILRINLAVFRAWAVSSFEMVAADQQLEGINCSELEFIPAGFFFRCMFSSNSLNACHLVRFVLLSPKVVLKVGCSYSTL